jgi:hypothetical protein
MVAASSNQKDGRPAPLRLSAAPNTPTISGSSTAGGDLIKTPRRTRRYVARRGEAAGPDALLYRLALCLTRIVAT